MVFQYSARIISGVFKKLNWKEAAIFAKCISLGGKKKEKSQRRKQGN